MKGMASPGWMASTEGEGMWAVDTCGDSPFWVHHQCGFLRASLSSCTWAYCSFEVSSISPKKPRKAKEYVLQPGLCLMMHMANIVLIQHLALMWSHAVFLSPPRVPKEVYISHRSLNSDIPPPHLEFCTRCICLMLSSISALFSLLQSTSLNG